MSKVWKEVKQNVPMTIIATQVTCDCCGKNASRPTSSGRGATCDGQFESITPVSSEKGNYPDPYYFADLCEDCTREVLEFMQDIAEKHGQEGPRTFEHVQQDSRGVERTT